MVKAVSIPSCSLISLYTLWNKFLSYSLTFPILFQAIGKGKESIFITVLRQVVLLVPLAWVFSFAGLNYVWLTFPVTEIITCSVSMIFYKKVFHKNA